MKRYFKYTAAAVSAVTMAVSAVPAMAAQVIVNDGTQKTAEAAEEVKAEETKTEEVKTEETKEETAQTPAEESIGYTALTGKITAISFDETAGARITFESEARGEIVLIENDAQCMVIVGNELKSVTDLKEGMEVTVVMNDLAPMTMSLPPQTTGAVAIVANGETPVFTAVDKFDDELTGKTLKLVMDENVQILDIRGTKQALTADDIKGHKAIVVYGASTKSIPAQTTPSFIIILDNGEETAETTETTETAETKTTETAETTETTETAETEEKAENVPLRTTLEAMGYTIEWTSNDAPIIITKDAVKAEIKIDSNTVVMEGADAKELSSNVVLVDGVTYIPADFVELLK